MDEGHCGVSLSQLASLHYALVYRYAFRLCGSHEEAEDLTQHAFLLAHRCLDQLRDESSAKAWLCAILRNTYLTRVSTSRARRTVSLNLVPEPVGETPRTPAFDSDELQQLLDDLPEEFRTPLILYYFEEFTYREIAEQMETPIGTVMSRLARGKSYLRERVEAVHTAAAQ